MAPATRNWFSDSGSSRAGSTSWPRETAASAGTAVLGRPTGALPFCRETRGDQMDPLFPLEARNALHRRDTFV